jgi:hypothetical protein
MKLNTALLLIKKKKKKQDRLFTELYYRRSSLAQGATRMRRRLQTCKHRPQGEPD